MMNDNNVDKVLEANFKELEKDLYEQEVTEPMVYFRFSEDNPLLTWSGLYKPRRS